MIFHQQLNTILRIKAYLYSNSLSLFFMSEYKILNVLSRKWLIWYKFQIARSKLQEVQNFSSERHPEVWMIIWNS